MPRLLDTRLVGLDLADVSSREYSAARPGQVLQVAADGEHMVLGAGSEFSYLTRDAEAERSGISLQQFMCRTWHEITPVLTPAYADIYGMAYGFGTFWITGVDINGRAKISSSLVDAITGSSSVETSWSDSFQLNGSNQVNVGSGSPSPFSGAVYGVIYENGIMLAYGANGRIAVLGSSGWEACNMPVGSEAYAIYRIAYGHRKGWVAVGTALSPPTANFSLSPGITLTSEDGFTWKISTPALGTGVPIYGVAYGGSFYGQNFFIAVGGVTSIPTNHIAYSLDGVNWTQQISAHPLQAHYSVSFGNGQWLIGTQRNTTTGSSILSSTVGQGSNTLLSWVPVGGGSNGNIQALAYGNGMFVAGSNLIYGGVSGTVMQQLPYSPPAGWAATSACYGNGIFLMASRTGKLLRSSTSPEAIGGAQGEQGPRGEQGAQGLKGDRGDQGPGASAQTVVTRNTSANEAITNSNQSYVYILDQAPSPGNIVTIVFNVPVNTSNTVERLFVSVRNPGTVGLVNQIAFSTGSLGGDFRGDVALAGPGFVIPAQYGPSLTEFYRLPNTTDWYYNLIYYDAGPPGDPGGGGN